MSAVVEPKPIQALVPTDIAFQTRYWGETKSRLGHRACAFDFAMHGVEGDLLLFEHEIAAGITAAYVPLGPESEPGEDTRGVFLESLSRDLARRLGPRTAFLRWDLPWECPYLSGATGGAREGGRRSERPELRVREMRMNFGTETWNLRAAPIEVQPNATLLIDLSLPLEEILARMKPKTRYNVRLAYRKGVSVSRAPSTMVPVFHELYRQTAARDGFTAASLPHFTALFEPVPRTDDGVEVLMLLASYEAELLAGAIVLFSGSVATYLVGASSNARRNHMASYAIQWEIIREAKARGCTIYDMFGVSPIDAIEHPLMGVSKFKRGFGGRLLHRTGCWDFPLDGQLYEAFRTEEVLGAIVSGVANPPICG
ncbi:MAG: peptidoglycan bridge formation glycyltransferase FemA/FemB family protein [Proteobacteria bacterium]|jgi:lipid II:glycine glycyltransferase (peptidoglycan interpeptide bridge formation enzyme)|nr:peptidoglycan bridge formation glycyltransferase FemA/FemB family protein [Pseudomonadota bacterium]